MRSLKAHASVLSHDVLLGQSLALTHPLSCGMRSQHQPRLSLCPDLAAALGSPSLLL